KCDVRFVNCKIENQFGFSEASAVEPDEIYFRKAASDFGRIKRKLAKKGLLASGPVSLLDVGCGSGAFLQLAQQDSWKVAGLELSPSIAAFACHEKGLAVHTGSIE